MAFSHDLEVAELVILSVFLASSKTHFLFILFDAAPQPIWLVFPVSLVFLVLFQVSFVVFSSPKRIVHLTHIFHNVITIVNIGSRKSFHHHFASSRVPKPARAMVSGPSGPAAIHWLRALALGWRLGY